MDKASHVFKWHFFSERINVAYWSTAEAKNSSWALMSSSYKFSWHSGTGYQGWRTRDKENRLFLWSLSSVSHERICPGLWLTLCLRWRYSQALCSLYTCGCVCGDQPKGSIMNPSSNYCMNQYLSMSKLCGQSLAKCITSNSSLKTKYQSF